MISNKKVVNYKVVDLIKIYNFSFGDCSIRVQSNNSKNLNFKIREILEYDHNNLVC